MSATAQQVVETSFTHFVKERQPRYPEAFPNPNPAIAPITEVVLIRHAQTEWNVQGRFIGQLDSPLTNQGLQDTELLARRLMSGHIDHIYCSDLGRSLVTASCITRHVKSKVDIDKRLRERSFGVFEGLSVKEIELKYPEVQVLTRHCADFAIPQGESKSQVLQRALSCVNELVKRHQGERIILVTHGGLMTVLLKHILGLHPDAERTYEVPNAAFNVLTYHESRRPNWMVKTLGDTCHLQQDFICSPSFPFPSLPPGQQFVDVLSRSSNSIQVQPQHRPKPRPRTQHILSSSNLPAALAGVVVGSLSVILFYCRNQHHRHTFSPTN